MDILVKAIESIREIGLTNNDLTRYGDGFEKAVELCLFSLKELNKQAQTEQLNIADIILSLPALQEIEDAVKTYSNGTTDNERDKKLISDAYRIGAYWAINTIRRDSGA